MAGLIKTILVLEKGVIPPNTNFECLNPKIDSEALNIKVGNLCRNNNSSDVDNCLSSVRNFSLGRKMGYGEHLSIPLGLEEQTAISF